MKKHASVPTSSGTTTGKPDCFLPGITIDDIPPGSFKEQLSALSPVARDRALAELVESAIPKINVRSLGVDERGTLFYSCPAPDPAAAADPIAGEADEPPPYYLPASTPISSPPIRHSRPGSPNVLYLDFNGHVVSGTGWSSTTTWNCLPFDTDGNPSTFSDTEQAAIIRVWAQVSEDYLPFDIDVTTEEPPSFSNNRVARALITKNIDANGVYLPSSTSGGVAFVNVFGKSYYATSYSPAFIYYNNLASKAWYIAEAAAHEVGHNMGLSHDGLVATATSDAVEYYSGHSYGPTSWGPIMGAPYGKNVTQWSKGEYFNANNVEDDLLKLSLKLQYIGDDVPSSTATATQALSSYSGKIERNTDSDVWWFETTGMLNITAKPAILNGGFDVNGNDLDIAIDILDAGGNLFATYAPSTAVIVITNTTVPEGTYFLRLRGEGAGNPTSSSPSGYTSYGSMGGYTLSLAVSTKSPYEKWADAYIPDGSLSDPSEDSDGNGILNLLRYAFGIIPGSPDQFSKLPAHTFATVGGARRFAISFRKISDSGVSYRVEQTSDIQGAWEQVDIAANTYSETDNGDGTTTVVVTSTLETDKIFMRLNVSM